MSATKLGNRLFATQAIQHNADIYLLPSIASALHGACLSNVSAYGTT